MTHIRCLLRAREARSGGGFTLLELMISLVLTLMLVFALVEVFDLMGENVRRTRGLIELSTQLRGATNQLTDDLQNVTVDGLPWASGLTSKGYLEIVEGPGRDADLDADGIFFEQVEAVANLVEPTFYPNGEVTTGTIYGDLDDILMFTVQSHGKPFSGRIHNSLLGGASNGHQIIESDTAEVIYWVQRNESGAICLCRRVILVKPELNVLIGAQLKTVPFSNLNEWTAFYADNDLSVKMASDGSGGAELNTLEDLTRRENRFAHRHRVNQYPYQVLRTLFPVTEATTIGGQDYKSTGPVLLPDVLGFDVKVYDPQAPLQRLASGGREIVLRPDDPGFDPQILSNPLQLPTGTFVNLGYLDHTAITTWSGSHFSGFPHPKSGLANIVQAGGYTYSTWPEAYEADGVDQDLDGMVDEGRNGIDDNALAGIDDAGEAETSPPYPYPLRGIEIQLRILDPTTRQMRQASVVQHFMGG